MPQITVNGESRSVQPDATVTALLHDLQLSGAPCAVEVNHAVIPRARHDVTQLSDGDVIEVVTLVGGG